MSLCILVPAQLREWGWLFGFALVSLALVALAVLADALYEAYRERISRGPRARPTANAHGEEQRFSGQADDAGGPRKKAA
jgi:hypothetical protein